MELTEAIFIEFIAVLYRTTARTIKMLRIINSQFFSFMLHCFVGLRYQNQIIVFYGDRNITFINLNFILRVAVRVLEVFWRLSFTFTVLKAVTGNTIDHFVSKYDVIPIHNSINEFEFGAQRSTKNSLVC